VTLAALDGPVLLGLLFIAVVVAATLLMTAGSEEG
jgi:hypothetical protein